jgi:phospholipid/cholesterol/gamma-HCH transport system substrate-binding protein
MIKSFLAKISLEILTGFIVLCFAFLFGYKFYKVTKGSVITDDSITIMAKFGNIDGIDIGSDVKISGVKIGSVKNIEIDKQSYKVIVRFTVKNEIQVPIDSSIGVVSSGLLGSKYLSIKAGSENIYCKDNDVLYDTQSSVNLEDLLGKLAFGIGGK